MASDTLARWLIVSAATHAAAYALLLATPRAASKPASSHPLDAIELAFDPAPRAEPPPPIAPPAPVEPAPAAPPEPPPPAARAARALARATPPPPSPASPRAPDPPPPAPRPPTGSALLTTPSPAPTFRAADLLRATTPATTLPTETAPAATAGGREALFEGSQGTELERARAASQGYVRGVLAAESHREAPGVRAYLWGVRRRVSEMWRPGVARVPNLGETLLAGLLSPERGLRVAAERFMRRQRQIVEGPPPRVGGAADAIEAIGGVAGNGPRGRQNIPADTNEESWRRNSRTTRAEVQVEQDAQGRVTSVRIVRSSGLAAFDNAALDAVRRGVAEQDPIGLPGGRRSRWSFTVTATRRLIAPSIGGSFDESRGWFQVQLPGQVILRSRVFLESSAPLDAPAT